MAIALLVSVADLIPRGLLAGTGCAVFRSTAGHIGTAIDLVVTRSMSGVDRTVSHPRELRGERWKRDLGEVGDDSRNRSCSWEPWHMEWGLRFARVAPALQALGLDDRRWWAAPRSCPLCRAQYVRGRHRARPGGLSSATATGAFTRGVFVFQEMGALPEMLARKRLDRERPTPTGIASSIFTSARAASMRASASRWSGAVTARPPRVS
jgi:hypothetical protein